MQKFICDVCGKEVPSKDDLWRQTDLEKDCCSKCFESAGNRIRGFRDSQSTAFLQFLAELPNIITAQSSIGGE